MPTPKVMTSVLMRTLRNTWRSGRPDHLIGSYQPSAILLALHDYFKDAGCPRQFQSSMVVLGSLEDDLELLFEVSVGNMLALDQGLVVFEHTGRKLTSQVSGMLIRAGNDPLFSVLTFAPEGSNREAYIRLAQASRNQPPLGGPAYMRWENGQAQQGLLWFSPPRWKEMSHWLDRWLPAVQM